MAAAVTPLAASESGWVEDLLRDGGYPGLFGLVVAENLFPPIPSEVVLPFAGFLVGQGTLSFVLAFAVATLGSLVGAMLLYGVGRWGGRPLLERWGRVLRLDARKLDAADDWFDRHGGKIVLFGRVIPGVRSIVSIPAGTSEMPIPRFLALTALGSGVWNAALIGAGWALGSNWNRLEGYVGPVGRIAFGVLVLAAVVGIVVLARRRRGRRAVV